MPRPKQRTEELRGRVVQAALETLRTEGPSGFTARRVARDADTSVPAVYELFGDKAGLVRELFFEGFRQLRRRFDAVAAGDTGDPRADLIRTVEAFRAFARDNPELAELMFSRTFADFDPGPDDLEAGAAVRLFIVGRVRRCIEAGVIRGNETDVAHVLVALGQGLAAQENAGWLGRSRASANRRWRLAVDAVLDGLR